VTGVIHAERSLIQAPLESLEGQFGLISHRAERDEVVVATDPFAFHALFVAERDNATYVSTSALALARHLRPAPSELGQFMFLRTGYQLGPVAHLGGDRAAGAGVLPHLWQEWLRQKQILATRGR
jgi:asparagine synthetase B (glutamine-hydrolysing)